MKNRNFFALLLCFLLVLQLFALSALAEDDETEDEEVLSEEEAAEDGVVLPPELDCKGAILVELNSDSTVFELNADERLYPASLTKIMTALLAVEAIERGETKLDTPVMASPNITYDLEADGSTAGITVSFTAANTAGHWRSHRITGFSS